MGIALIGAASLLSGAAADAAVVFQDTFEDTIGALPAIPDNPQVGSYPGPDTTDPESQVKLAGGSNPAAPDASLNLLKIADKQRNYGTPTVAAVTGETITYDVDLYNSLGITSFALLGDQGNDISDSQNVAIWINITATKVQYRDGVDGSSAWVTVAGLDPSVGTWEHYTVDYTVGDSTFDLTAGATIYSALNINTAASPTAINAVAIAMGGATGTVGFIDNPTVNVVPEPASLSLIGAGLLLMVRRTRNH